MKVVIPILTIGFYNIIAEYRVPDLKVVIPILTIGFYNTIKTFTIMANRKLSYPS